MRVMLPHAPISCAYLQGPPIIALPVFCDSTMRTRTPLRRTLRVHKRVGICDAGVVDSDGATPCMSPSSPVLCLVVPPGMPL